MKKPITIVHLTSSLKIGGAETILCDLVNHLNRYNFKQYVVYFHAGPNVERLADTGVELIHIKGLFFRYDPWFFARLFRVLKALSPDCIHALLWAANVTGRIMARWLKIPCVTVYHNNVDQDGTVRNVIDRLTLLYADDIVAVSPGVAQSLTQCHSWLPATSIRVIRNGIDADAVRKRGMQLQKSPYELGLSEEHCIIGSVGRLVPLKRFDLLLESFVLVNTAVPLSRLVLIGSGPEEQALRHKATSLGVDQSVIFVGSKEAYGYYPLFSCFVMSSDKEGMSIALLEALSFGLPCVVTHTGDEHPIIQSGKNGVVVEAGNARALATALTSVLGDEEARIALGQAARESVDRTFNVDGMVGAYKSLFETAVERNSRFES